MTQNRFYQTATQTVDFEYFNIFFLHPSTRYARDLFMGEQV